MEVVVGRLVHVMKASQYHPYREVGHGTKGYHRSRVNGKWMWGSKAGQRLCGQEVNAHVVSNALPIPTALILGIHQPPYFFQNLKRCIRVLVLHV
jgi:hypothetical protein